MNQPISVSVPYATRTTIELVTTIGLDLSDRASHYHVLTGDGTTLEAGKVSMEPKKLGEFFERWRGCRLVIEAGTHSPWVSRLGVSSGLETVVASTRDLPQITNSVSKSDRNDARRLAEHGCKNPEMLRPVVHRSEQAQADLATPESRDMVVAIRSRLILRVKAVVKSFGARLPKHDADSFARCTIAELPEALRRSLEPLVRLIASASAEIKVYDREIERLTRERYPQARQLRQIPGVGPVTALTFVLKIGDVTRFTKARDVGAYLGLVPRSRSSGDSNPQLHISKHGDGSMRRLAVLCAHVIMQERSPDCDLKRFGERIAGPDGDGRRRKRAIVAVARKLVVLMAQLLKTGEVYDPLHLAKKRGDDEVA